MNLVTALVPLRHSMLGQLSWKNQANSSLDLPGSDSWLLVVAGKVGCLRGNLLENVVDEGVQDGHSLGTDSSVGVDLQWRDTTD